MQQPPTTNVYFNRELLEKFIEDYIWSVYNNFSIRNPIVNWNSEFDALFIYYTEVDNNSHKYTNRLHALAELDDTHFVLHCDFAKENEQVVYISKNNGYNFWWKYED